MDPITLIVTALAAGATAGLTDTVSQAVKDAYAGLKSLIARKYATVVPAVEQLEAAPASKGRRAVAEEDLGGTAVGNDTEMLRQAQALLDAVQQHAPEAARTIGVDLQEIKAGSLKLGDILAQAAAGPVTGVKVKNAEVTGELTIRGVRVTSGPAPAAAVAARLRIKILFLAANPTDTTWLRLDQEVRAIDEALRLAEYRERFELAQAHAVRVRDLHGLLMRHQPHIVHFSGHGSPAGEIMLEDEAGRVQAVAAHALATTFALLKDHIRCVVLNACFSQTQAAAIAQHIGCVVGMATAIGDQAAVDFAAGFYQALAYGRSIQTAFELGCNLIDLSGLGEQDTPQLLAQHTSAALGVFA